MPAAGLAATLLLAPGAQAVEPRTGEVTIRRGADGTPHIRATSWEALGYGFARAHAQDDLCVLANTYVTVRAERSRYFGPAERAAKVKDPACAGKAWVKPIAEIDVYRRFYQLSLLASQMVAVDGIGGAQPTTPDHARAGVSGCTAARASPSAPSAAAARSAASSPPAAPAGTPCASRAARGSA